MRKQLVGGLLFLLAMFVFSSTVMAQNTAQISGTVTDKSGAVVPKAAVSAVDESNGTTRTTTTNGTGDYSLPFLRASTYKVTVQAAGFQPFVKTGIVLTIDQSLQLNFTVQVGTASETVTVNAAGEMLQTDSATVGTVVDRQFIEDMPLNGRTFQSLIELSPGVVATGASVGAGQFSVNGQRSDDNYFTIDGVSANVGGGNGLGGPGPAGVGSGVQTTAGGGYNNMVSVDALQEFRIETSTFAPEFGRLPGGQVILQTRAGTNAYHGDVYEYLRNTVFDANNWFNNYLGLPIAPERQNDFGGVVGGPILRDKLFFFFNYEGQRLTIPQNAVTDSVPTLCARGLGSCTGTNVAAPAVLQPFLQAFPRPSAASSACALTGTTATDPNVAPYCVAFSDKVNLNAYSLRLDWNVTSKILLFARANDAPSDGFTLGALPSEYTLSQFKLRTVTVGNTWVIKSNVTNDLRFNYTYSPSEGAQYNSNYGGAVPITSSFLGSIPNYSGGGITFSGGDLTGSVGVFPLGTGWTNQKQIIDTVAWSHGKHQMKFGGDFRRIQSDIIQESNFFQEYLFSLSIAGMPASTSWMQNEAGTYVSLGQTRKNWWYYNTAFFGQDTWKITPRLTLTYGLRWDINPAPYGPAGGQLQALTQLNFNNLSATQVAPLGTPAYPTQWTAISPRLGAAYQLSNDPRWGRVVRGGFGRYYDTGDLAGQAAVGPLATAVTSGNSTTKIISFPQPASVAMPPSPAFSAPWGLVSTVSPNFRLPYTDEWNVAVEQQLGRMQTLTVTYVGSRGLNLIRRDQYFPFNTNFTQDTYAVGSEGWSNYNALQAQYQRRMSHGLQVLASYTWSHCLDTASDQFVPGANAGLAISPNIEPVSDFYGNCDYDIRHQFHIAFRYDIPSPSKNQIVTAVLGHWGMDTTFGIRSALPVDLEDSNVDYAGAQPYLPSNPANGPICSEQNTTNPCSTTRNTNGGQYPIRPFIVPGQPFWLYGAACEAALEGGKKPCPGGKGLNPAAFANSLNDLGAKGFGLSGLPAATASLTQGTLGRNQLRSFGWNQIDFSLRRDFPITERIKLQFRSDFFNLLNHPSFYLNSTNFSGNPLNVANTVGTFGVGNSSLNTGLVGPAVIPQGLSSLYQIGGPRSMQFSLKLVF